VAGSVDEAHERIAGRHDEIAQRVDRDAIAGEPLCEGGVGHVIERNDNAGDGREQRERAAIHCHWTGPGGVSDLGHGGNV